MTPYAALQAQDFHTPAYSETDQTGGGFGLTYAAMNATDVRTELGARFDSPTVVDGMPLTSSRASCLGARFCQQSIAGRGVPGAAGRRTSSSTVRRFRTNSALTSAGAELFLTPRWTLLAKFDGEFANGSQTYAGSGTLRYTW